MLCLPFASIKSFGQAPEDLIHSSTSYVDDFAGIYTPEQAQELDGIIRNFHNTVQISLVTVKSLNGIDPSDFATRLGNKWGVGSVSNNGLLILIAPAEHKFFAATGKGIEGNLTDLKTGEIYREYARPRFKDNDYFGGTKAMLNKYIEYLSPQAGEIQSAQTDAVASHDEKATESSLATGFAWFVTIGLVVLLAFIFVKRKKDNKIKEDKKASDFKSLQSRYNAAIQTIDIMVKTLKASPNYKESIDLLGSIEILNSLRVTNSGNSEVDSNKMEAYLKAHDSFIVNSNGIITQFNAKKKVLDGAEITYNKYNKPSWRTDCLEIVNNLTAGLVNMTFTKAVGVYQEDIKQMSALITAILDSLANLKAAIDSAEGNAISGLIANMNGSETTFKNLNIKLSKVISDDNEKLSKANSAKAQIAHETEKYRSYIDKKGVSSGAAQKTKHACAELEGRLSEFDGLDPIKAYALYLLLYGQLDSCKPAMIENNEYVAEQQRIQKRKDDEAAAIAAAARRKRQAEEAEADRIRRKRQQDDDDDRRRNSSSSSAYIYGSSISDNSNSSSSNDSSFGGGSFGGGGAGGDW